MPSAHAKLSPSDSARWIPCPAALRVEEEMLAQGLISKDEDSVYAREGTIAHALGEIEAGYEFGLITRKAYLAQRKQWLKEFHAEGYSKEQLKEMEAHIVAYVALIGERLERHPHSQVLLEQRLDTGVEKCWGTSDVVIFSPTHVEIIDLKYGSGVPVSAEENSQLRLYGLGALDAYGDLLGETVEIYMTVFQPRAGNGQPSTEKLHPDDLRAWREGVVKPSAAAALHSDNAKFGPSEKACRWCPAAGLCRARIMKDTLEDFGDIVAEEEPQPSQPELLTMEELARAFGRLSSIRAWCAAVEATALEAAYGQGKTIPGYKVVRSGGQRSIKDHAAAIQTLIDEGYGHTQVANVKAKGIGDLEKLLGKKQFEALLGKFVEKSPGRESLVPEDDKREAISPASEAAKDFEAA